MLGEREDVEELVDRVLASVPAGLRDACDRVGILAGLQEASTTTRLRASARSAGRRPR